MDQDKQADAFLMDLQKLLDRYMSEFDLTIVSAIGALETVKLDLFSQMFSYQRGGPDEDEFDD